MNGPNGTDRRGRSRRRASWTVAVVLTGIIAAVVYWQSQLLPARIAGYVNTHYLAGTNFELSVGGISGFFLRHIELKNPVLRYHSETASYNVFRADELSVTYELMPIFAFRLIVGDLTLHNVSIHLRQAEDGKLVLPVPQGVGTGKRRLFDVSPVVDVRRFTIDGLEMKFGGTDRELAVRDVNLAGSFHYADHVGELKIDEGRAYLIDSGKTVSSIRLAARSDWTTVFLDDFALRLDKSFVIANGEFREGRLRGVDVVFNPVSLGELYELGLTPEMEGEFKGRMSLSGTVDSLAVKGEVTGEGLGVELDGVEFAGAFTPEALDLERLAGAVFGSKVDGAFRVAVEGGDFEFDGTCEDLDLGRGFITDTELPPMSLTGRVAVQYTKRDERYAWSGDLSRAVVDGFECFNVRGEGVYEEATGMSIRRLALERPGFRAEGTGTVASPGDVADIVFKVDGNDLGYFWKHFELPHIGGAVALNGRLHGPIEDFQINLNGAFTGLVFENMAVDSGTVQVEARRIGTLAPEVSASLVGRRGTISGHAFDAPVVQIEVDTNLVQVRNARFARGDTSIVADLDVKGRGERARIDVRRVTVTTPADAWATVRPSVMRVAPGVLEMDSLTLVCPRGELGLAGVIREREKTLNLVAWGRGINLAVVRDAARLPFQVRGTGDFALTLDGPSADPRARLSADITAGVVDSVSFDALTVDASFNGSSYRVEELRFVAGRDTVRAHGSWACNVSPLRIGRGERPESLWKAPMAFDFTFDHFPLAVIFAAMHRPTLIAAAYDGTLRVGGSLETPTAHARGDIVPARGEGRELPPARLDVAYRDGALRVDEIALTDVVDLRIAGTFPLVLSLRDGARIESDQPLEFRLELAPREPGETAEVGRYLNGVSLLRGVMSGTVVGSGTPAAPRLSGGISLSRGELRVVGLQEAFSDLAVRVDFIDDVVRLTSLSARSGEKGTIIGTGWARVSNYRPVDYKADLTVRDFWLRSIPDVETRQDGSLAVRLTQWRDGRKIPHITGALDIREANIEMELGPGTETQSEFTRPTDRPDWVCSVDLSAAKNVWIRNPDLTMEMAGDVILNRDERGLYFRGDMSVLRGSYKIYGNKFQITEGQFDFSASEALRPSMQISAYTLHRSGDAEEKNIYLSLSWPYDQKEPRIRLSHDDPGYSEADIWAMLGGYENLASGAATNALERVISAQMTGVTIDVDRRQVGEETVGGKAAESVTSIGVGKYLWEDVYLQYRRGLSVESEQEVNVEYRLGSRFLLRSQFIYNSRRSRSGIVGKNTDEYNLDLKYRFEF